MRQIRVESSDKLTKFILSKSHFRTFSIDKQGQEKQQIELMSLSSQLQNELPGNFKEQFKQITQQIINKPNDPQNLLQNFVGLMKLVLLILKNNEQKDGSQTLREVREIDKMRVNTLLVQNNKLAIEIKQLSNKLKEIEESQDVVRLKEEVQRITQTKDEQINKLIILNDQKEKQVSKNGQLIIQLKSVIQKQDSQIQILENYLESDKQKYGNIEKTYDKLVSDNKQLREVTKMQEEDLIAHYVRHRHYLREEAKSRKKLLLLQEEIDKVKVEKSKRPEIPKYDAEQEQKLQKLTYSFANDKQYFKIMKDLTQLNIGKLSDQEQTTIMFLKNVRYDYIYHDSLTKFQHPRPSFLLFFESNMKTLEQEYRNIEFHNITSLFFAKIRAILDSQFNEFQYHDRQFTLVKFADFVYGWISTFDINPKTKEIEQIANRSYEHLEPIRTDFILDCLSPKVSKLNEIIAFNELLFELSSPDELYYYLYCRFLIFKGNVSSQSRYSFEAVLYVSLHWAQQILQLLLWKYDQNLFSSINQVIIESSVTKGTGTLVDGHYVLRILLELYRQERKNRLAMLKEVFSACVSVQSSGKSGVTYKNFKKIFSSNFPDVCDSEICALFRESFMCGDGVVTAESFFTAASENCFFIKQILLKNLLKIPIVELNEIAYRELNLPFLDFYSHYKQLPHHLIHKCCLQFGLQSVLMELDGLHKLIKDYFQDQYNQYSLYTTISKLIHIYNTVIDLHLRHNNTFNQEWDQSEIEALKSLNNQLSQLFSPLIDYDSRQKLQQIVRIRKLKPLQYFIRKRVQRFYHMIANLINNNNNMQQDPQLVKRRFTKQSSIKMF